MTETDFEYLLSAKLLEEDARAGEEGVEIALVSLAISAKRIADALEGGLSAGGFADFENLAWSMGQAFERGRAAA